MYKGFFKRVFDFAFALVMLMILLIPLLLIALIIKLDSKGPVLFTQKRVGRDKKHFTIYKFRSMKTDAPGNTATHLLKDPEAFITKTGKFLRKSSLDELPQLINILTGDMSLIGPRPALWNQYDLIEKRDAFGANAVRPGLTGLAQVSGRDELEIGEKARLDGEYVKNITFIGDMKIIFDTFKSVLSSKGYREGKK
ncbi:MAG: sugar transferase [Clostridia bacterium]|nr:sugar transferase [Clostridia bacterium]